MKPFGACYSKKKLGANQETPSSVDRDITGQYIHQDISGDIAKIDEWSGSAQISNSQGLDLPGQARSNKQSKSLDG